MAVVSNPLITGQMIPLTTSVFEKQNPGITVKFATYTEGDLRAAIEKDVSTHSNAFNVIMIGPYETPLFAKNGWLTNLSTQYIASDPSYDAADLLPSISKALSYNGDLTPGQRVTFRVQPDDIFAFHPVTGARLAG